ncbi:hypothetical protein KY328_02575 [Candidatus Woesearchaeota archaeon]|nr:hypothetical protein [Candidatus Woesearchaeota archaeon]
MIPIEDIADEIRPYTSLVKALDLALVPTSIMRWVGGNVQMETDGEIAKGCLTFPMVLGIEFARLYGYYQIAKYVIQ